MDESTFDVSDLSRLFLLRSHTEICKSLAPLVESRMRRAFPRDWKEKVASCFSRATREKVRDGLNNGKKIEDVFVLCKIVRRYIRVVFRVEEKKEEVNGNVAKEDFQWTEYLHRTVEAMETIRNRAFHGEGVFPDEVMASISHGSQTMSLLTRTTEDNRVDCTLGVLRLLRRELCDFLNERVREVCVTAAEGTDVFLRRCLTQLEKDLRSLLQNTFTNEFDHTAGSNHISELNDLNVVLDFLKTHANRSEMRVHQTTGIRSQQLNVACQSVKEIRNRQAHERASCSTLPWLRNKLEKAHILWKAFGLDMHTLEQVLRCIDQPSTETSWTGLKASGMFKVWTVPVILVSPSGKHFMASLSHRRATRSKGKAFVGRTKELLECESFLCRAPCRSRSGQRTITTGGKLLVITGASGVGKTSLAGEALDIMREQYPRKMWLCSSTPEILMAELGTHLPCDVSSDESALDQIDSLSKAAYQISLLAEELIILDDVTVESLEIVKTLFSSTCHTVVVTTCCGHLECFKEFSKGFLYVKCIHISCLSTDSSLELIKLREIPLEGCEATLRTIIETELENLPLAVNIFISLLQEQLWKKPKNEVSNSKKGTPCSIAAKDQREIVKMLLAHFQSNLKEEMVMFSLRSTESPHIRGIAGLVNIAVKRLVQEPSALCLVILVVMAGPMGLPLQHMTSCWSATRLYSELDIDSEDIGSMRLVSAVECLLGPDGSVREAALEFAISTGLVTQEENRALHIHQLLVSYFEKYVLDNVQTWSDWIETTPSTAKFILSVLFAEHCLINSSSIFKRLDIQEVSEKRLGTVMVFSLISHLGKVAQNCTDKIWPKHLSWLSPFYQEFYARSNCFSHEIRPENFLSFLRTLGSLRQMYDTKLINHCLWVLIRWSVALVSLPVVSHLLAKTIQVEHPRSSSSPPCNLFYFVGAPNLVWQTFVSKEHDMQMSVKNGTTEEVDLCTVTGVILLVCKYILRGLQPMDSLQKFNVEKEYGVCSLLSLELEALLKMQLYPQAVRLLLANEKRLDFGQVDHTTSGERSLQLDILLAGSIVYCSVGLSEKAKTWCKELLRRIKNEQVSNRKHKRYCSMAYAVLGHSLLLENSISECLHIFTMAMCSIGSELECAWHLADKSIGECCSLFSAYHEIIQVHACLSWFLSRSKKEVAKIDRLENPNTTPTSQKSLVMACRPVLSGRIEDVGKNRISKILTVLGRLYQDGLFFFEEEDFKQAKHLLSQWLECWHKLLRRHPQFRDKVVPEAALLSTLAMHVLRSLGRICEQETSLSEAVMFYTRSLNQLDGMFTDIHLTRADLHSDLVRVLLKLGKSADATEHAQRTALIKLTIFGQSDS